MNVILKPHEKGVLPAWFWVGVGLACAAGIGAAVRFLPAGLAPPCGFHVVTGHPCPTCGMTRMGFLILEGEFAEALRMNPFLFLLCSALGFWVAAGAGARAAGRDLFVDIPEREEMWWWLALIAGFMANWAYLWRMGV